VSRPAIARAEASLNESTFMAELLVALGHHLPVRCWRQNAGVFHLAGGMVAKGAPEGAADITGVVIPEGWRLEVEVKSATGRMRPEQVRWEGWCGAWGAVHAVVKYDARQDPAANVARGVEIVRAAIAARAARA